LCSSYFGQFLYSGVPVSLSDCGLLQCAPVDTELDHDSGGIGIEWSYATMDSINFTAAYVAEEGSALYVARAASQPSSLSRLNVRADKGSWNSLAVLYGAVVLVDQANFADLPDSSRAVFVESGPETRSQVRLTECHFVNVGDDHYFYEYSLGDISLFNCFCDHAMQTNMSCNATSGNIEWANATLIPFEFSFAVCPPTGDAPPSTASARASPTATNLGSRSRTAVASASRSPGATSSGFPDSTASGTDSGDAKGKHKTGVIVGVVFGVVGVVAIACVLVLWLRRRNARVPDVGEPMKDDPLLARPPERDVVNS
jgi:hypothetical protein